MKKYLLFALLLTFTSLSSAQVVIEKLQYTKANKIKIKKSSLSLLKEFEQNKKWKECVKQSPMVFKGFASVRPWIMTTWLICAQKSSDKDILTALSVLEKNKNLLLLTSARKSLANELIRARSQLIENSLKNNPTLAWLQMQNLVDFDIDKETQAKLLYWSGELANNAHELEAAETFYQQSLDLAETKLTKEKLNSIRLALNSKKTTTDTLAKINKTDVLSDGEYKFEERFKTSLKSNDLISFVEDAVTYLNQYPNGKRSKWAMEKILDIYQNFSENPQDEKFVSLKEKALSILEKLDVTAVAVLARNFHRKNDFKASQRLADRALTGLSQSQQAAILLYVAGRSAQFLGDFKKAKKYFEQYIEFHSLADDINEVQFRLALVHFRNENYSSAIAVLEKLLLGNGIGRYELSARYWLVRSLQATQNPRAVTETDSLIENYPYTYYGLRLRAEKNSLKLDPLDISKKIDEFKVKAYFTPFQKQTWDRALLLGQNGWLTEALTEISEMTWGNSADVKSLLGQKLSENKIYSTSIKLISDALDSDIHLRSLNIIRLGYPEAYLTAIDSQAKKYRLNSILLKSLIRQESAFNEKATSSSKAMGLMQLIPPTAVEVAKTLGLHDVDLPSDSYFPDINIQMGTSYIARMIKQFGGNVPLGLAAYNAGPSRVQIFVRSRPEIQELTTRFSSAPKDELWFDELPWSETSFYVKAILRNSIMYRWIAGGSLQLPPLLWQDLALGNDPESGPVTGQRE